jgi:PII-like signaling protein
MTPKALDMLKFYVSCSDQWEGKPLHEALVSIAHHEGIAGAYVFQAELGFGHNRQIHDILSEYASDDPPLTVEIVDTPANIQRLIEKLRPLAEAIVVTRTSSAPLRAVHTPPLAQEETPEMITGEHAQRASIYICSTSNWHGTNLAVALVEHCRTLGYAGITVTRGVMGFGKSAQVHKTHPFHFSQELPEKVEVIDTPERIASLLSSIEPMVSDALVLVENVEIIHSKR